MPARTSLNPKGYKGPLANRYSFKVPPHLSEVEAEAWAAAVRAARVHQSDPGACETATGAIRTYGRSPARHDAFRHGGLSKSAFKVWEALTDSPVSLRDLSTRLGYKRPDSMRRLLAVLAHHGLAAKADDGWRRLTPDLDALARDLGTSGKGEAQQKLHGAQRARAAAKVGTTDDRSTAWRFVMQELVEDPAGRLAVDELQRAYFRWFDTLKSGRPEIDRLPEMIKLHRPGARLRGGVWDGLRLRRPRLARERKTMPAIHFGCDMTKLDDMQP